MSRQVRVSIVIGLVLLCTPTNAEPGATRQRSGAWGGAGYGQSYRKGTAVTVRGNVLSSEEFTPAEGMEPGLQLKVDTGEGDLVVHLGPRWFVTENDYTFIRGEPLTIVGVRISFDRKPVVIASEVVKKSEKIILRELTTGRPRWDSK